MNGQLFIISAPSGAGKTSLVKALINEMDSHYRLTQAITFTSKRPRPGDQNGIDYHFISEQDFEKRIKKHFFIEWSNAYGTYYGAPRYLLKNLTNGVSYIMVLDRIGAQQVKQQYPQAILIWINTSTIQKLELRLSKRGTENCEQIAYRLKRAKIEIELEQKESLYEYHILNDNFAVALQALKKIVIKNLKKNKASI